jgi:hypothetical protein
MGEKSDQKNPKKTKKSKYVRPSGRAGSATEKAEAGSATENTPRNVQSPTDGPPTNRLSEFIYV